MTSVLILGAAGSVGSVIARELLATSQVDVIAADLGIPVAGSQDWMSSPRVSPITLDVSDGDALSHAIRKAAIVVNATAMRFAMQVTRAALAERVHLVDLGTYHDTAAQLALSEQAADAGVRIVIGAGVAPGLTNLLARYGAEQLDTVDAVRIHSFLVNAMFESPANILDRFDAGRLEGLVYRDGTLVKTAPLAEVEAVEFAPPVGRQFLHLMPHPEVLTLPLSTGAPNVEFKTGYPPVEDEILDAFRAAGLDSSEPFDFRGIPIIPRQLVAAVAGTSRRGSISTANLKRVTVDGLKDGQAVRLLYETAVHVDGGSATSQITGAMAAVATLEVLERGVPGVHAAEGGLDPARVMRALSKRGYRVAETRTASRMVLSD